MFGGKKNKTQTSSAPKPATGRLVVNGQPVSQTYYSRKNNSYNITGQMNAADQQLYNAGQTGLNTLMPQIAEASRVDPAKRQQHISALYDPAAEAINQSFDTAEAQGVGRFNAMGGQDSTSMADYLINNVGKQRASSLNDAKQKAIISSYDLPMMEMQPLLAAGAYYQDSVNQPYTRMMQGLDPSFQGQTMGTNQAFQQWQANQATQPKRRSFLGSLFE